MHEKVCLGVHDETGVLYYSQTFSTEDSHLYRVRVSSLTRAPIHLISWSVETIRHFMFKYSTKTI